VTNARHCYRNLDPAESEDLRFVALIFAIIKPQRAASHCTLCLVNDKFMSLLQDYAYRRQVRSE
jgi:hypothetical protein